MIRHCDEINMTSHIQMYESDLNLSRSSVMCNLWKHRLTDPKNYREIRNRIFFFKGKWENILIWHKTRHAIAPPINQRHLGEHTERLLGPYRRFDSETYTGRFGRWRSYCADEIHDHWWVWTWPDTNHCTMPNIATWPSMSLMWRAIYLVLTFIPTEA